MIESKFPISNLNEMDASGSPITPMNSHIMIKNKYPQNKIIEEINTILKNKQKLLKDNKCL